MASNIEYPNDTPEWLKQTIENIGLEVEDAVIRSDTASIQIAQGQLKLYRRLREEIDALGRKEKADEAQISRNATLRAL